MSPIWFSWYIIMLTFITKRVNNVLKYLINVTMYLVERNICLTNNIFRFICVFFNNFFIFYIYSGATKGEEHDFFLKRYYSLRSILYVVLDFKIYLKLVVVLIFQDKFHSDFFKISLFMLHTKSNALIFLLFLFGVIHRQ